MANKKITELPVGTSLTGVEVLEIVQGGANKQIPISLISGASRELNRAFSSELLFDKNEIDYVSHELTGDLSYTVSASDNLVDQFSVAVQTITTDGTHSISFTGYQFIYGIQNGQTPEAGTYQVFFMYRNGISTVNFASPSLQGASGVQLSAPPNFAAIADGENAIDLSWDNVTGNQGYLIEWSADGSTGWTTLETTAVDAVASTQTGLTEGTERFYRITTLGNGTSTLNSAYATASATTEDAGDVTPPTFTFSPTDAETDINVDQPIIITASEPVRDTDGVTVITNANAADYITLKETNSGGANIPFTATIDVTKTIFTITPTGGYGGNQLVFVEIGGVEDLNGNDAVADNITFTTSGYTTLNGTTNHLKFGDILDGVWALDNTQFKLKITIKDIPLTGERLLLAKYSGTDNQRSWMWVIFNNDIQFNWCRVGTSVSRVIRWTGALTDSLEHELELRYNGSIDTNDGLDRCSLYIDGVLQGSKSLVSSVGVLSGIIFASSAQLSFGVGVSSAGSITYPSYFEGKAKDLQILSGAGDVNELEVPILIEGTDISGNGHTGTWV